MKTAGKGIKPTKNPILNGSKAGNKGKAATGAGKNMSNGSSAKGVSKVK